MSMLIIQPVVMTDAMLVSSTVPENDFTGPWNPATNYTAGQKVVRATTHRVYENKLAGVDATLPESATTTRWQDIGPTSRWAMFDDEVGSVTRGPSPLTVVLKPGQVGGLALLELEGVEQVQLRYLSATGGTLVYTRDIDMEEAQILDVWDWFFLPYELGTDVLVSDLPPYADGELTITLIGPGTVGCGVCKVGPYLEVGETELGFSVGIESYSRKTKNAFGRYQFKKSTQRDYAKTMDISVEMPRAAFNRVFRTLAKLLDVPCIYVLDDGEGLEAAALYGIYLDFSIVADLQLVYVCNLNIESLI